MAEYTVIGSRPYDFTDKDGKALKGVSVYSIAAGDEHTTGQICERFSLSNQKLTDMRWTPAVGDVFTPYYNKYGKVDAVQLQGRAK